MCAQSHQYAILYVVLYVLLVLVACLVLVHYVSWYAYSSHWRWHQLLRSHGRSEIDTRNLKTTTSNMKRACNWEHPEGPAATEKELASALRPYAHLLAMQNVDVYPSDDFKVGIKEEKLVEHAAMIQALINIDNRGGHFGQRRMAEAVSLACKADMTVFLQSARCRGTAHQMKRDNLLRTSCA